MKKLTFILFGILFIVTACKKNHTCTCTEKYTGLEKNYETKTDSIIEGMKKDDAKVLCDEGDIPAQTIMTETIVTDCEL
ncbi:hypothetical protein [Crocinitomix catalasitica]|uniref:hypothetical protein n=1 Tax=Crocinitomix catalasitica TaxID=184607 RepID=UPI00047FC54D|nr:hypothetical protein [Crocinitomix catalasitica]